MWSHGLCLLDSKWVEAGGGGGECKQGFRNICTNIVRAVAGGLGCFRDGIAQPEDYDRLGCIC